ncbi:signal peptidase I [Candidatus Woesearchaeota archaeon]|nr:signal peptidase I [Candidatus Woesearchaeota archaeon]
MARSRKALSWRKVWKFIWDDNSIWSWLVNVILAFVLIKFIIFPTLGFVLSTTHPIVAVVSGSMEHDARFEPWWEAHGQWYESRNITLKEFRSFPFREGFNRGDIMLLYGKKPKDIKRGDVIVFQSTSRDPIIHRVVDKRQDKSDYVFQTKGDNNADSIKTSQLDETRIPEAQVIGAAVFRIPLLGYVKIIFIEIIQMFQR